ncbi:GNAT family acetyltransferase [Saccharopolyspora subtropica]|uniref:GNAT family N-acetyltransferase n=1 Tax=Saccharopolyspora thermophila TaxID=89367 RepID=A0A917JZV7_9PSEU|nr:GNAT family N-acetyltransferase [Saccharopolyspora subtropica]GGI95232.1 GNAT family acetyltransferase [Saccharopolyspora subtropica]
MLLETERLVLRELVPGDVDEVFALCNDPAVMRYINGGAAVSRDEVVAEIMPRFLAYQECFGGPGTWAAVERDRGRFLGIFMLHPTGDDAELGYRLHRAAWGRGFATEGATALVREAFGASGLRRVWAQTMTVNRASRRVLEKTGLRYVRTFFTDWPEGPIDGSEHGDVEYEVTREQWSARYR